MRNEMSLGLDIRHRLSVGLPSAYAGFERASFQRYVFEARGCRILAFRLAVLMNHHATRGRLTNFFRIRRGRRNHQR